MIHLTPFRQTPGLCGPASLKILLAHYGHALSEQELSALCGATVEHGTDHAGLVKAVETLGKRANVKTNASIEDLCASIASGDPVLVGWFSGDGDHYSVVFDVDREFVHLMDPELEHGVRRILISDFEKVWYDFDTPEHVKVERWMMTVQGKKT